jgi:predicted GIY-YIG superfamily endonuclease
MLCITVQDLLQGKFDQELKGHVIYMVSEDDKVFYIGKTRRDPKQRLYEHLFQSRQPNKSKLGTFIIQNLPVSLTWIVKLLTLKDCEPIMMKLEKGLLIRGFFSDHEFIRMSIQYIIDRLPFLCLDSSLEETQQIKDVLAEQPTSLSNFWDVSRKLELILDSLGKPMPILEDEHYPYANILERYYDIKHVDRVAEFVEWILIEYNHPCLNVTHNRTNTRDIPAKYSTRGLNLK